MITWWSGAASILRERQQLGDMFQQDHACIKLTDRLMIFVARACQFDAEVAMEYGLITI
jgi:hypothetical protein